MLFGAVLIAGMAFFVGCSDDGDDPTPELYPIPGTYVFNEAILQTAIEIPGVPIPISKGTDITDQMAGGLLAEAPCDDPNNGGVELKESKELYFTCIGEDNEAKAGTWSINGDTTQLNLNLAVAAGDLQLKIEDLVIDEVNDLISGSITNFPITKTLIAGFLAGIPGGDAILAGLDDDYTVLVDVDIEFKKVSE